MADREPLTLRAEGERYDTYIKGIIAKRTTNREERRFESSPSALRVCSNPIILQYWEKPHRRNMAILQRFCKLRKPLANCCVRIEILKSYLADRNKINQAGLVCQRGVIITGEVISTSLVS